MNALKALLDYLPGPRVLYSRRVLCLVLPHKEITLQPDGSDVWLSGDQKVREKILICTRCLHVRRRVALDKDAEPRQGIVRRFRGLHEGPIAKGPCGRRLPENDGKRPVA